ncbi:hypothetical protein BV898_01250 [Hypsibius exemplaris]|uniref:Uncharacterized protein n=1 Tax=Hypsibius exemplaris TaxID=2072580 RepID=A0A1W0XC17_HYPEX|nr:hypothetical protein BV898_01250 [Hypsibius exemplaris]
MRLRNGQRYYGRIFLHFCRLFISPDKSSTRFSRQNVPRKFLMRLIRLFPLHFDHRILNKFHSITEVKSAGELFTRRSRSRFPTILTIKALANSTWYVRLTFNEFTDLGKLQTVEESIVIDLLGILTEESHQ